MFNVNLLLVWSLAADFLLHGATGEEKASETRFTICLSGKESCLCKIMFTTKLKLKFFNRVLLDIILELCTVHDYNMFCIVNNAVIL